MSENSIIEKPYHIQFKDFEGPFDLLLHLLEEEEMDIYSVPIGRITDNYLAYLNKMRDNKLDIGSEFLLLATTLLELKSRSLLPIESNEGDIDFEVDRLSLLDRLVEYKVFKQISEEFAERVEDFSKVGFRTEAIQEYVKNQDIQPVWVVSGADINKLIKAFDELWKRKIEDIAEEKEIPEDTLTVREKISSILDALAHCNKIQFRDLFTEKNTKLEIIVTFLAVLEVTRRQLIKIIQDEKFGEIALARAWE